MLSGQPLGLAARVVESGIALRIARDDLFEVLGERPELLRQNLRGDVPAGRRSGVRVRRVPAQDDAVGRPRRAAGRSRALADVGFCHLPFAICHSGCVLQHPVSAGPDTPPSLTGSPLMLARMSRLSSPWLRLPCCSGAGRRMPAPRDPAGSSRPSSFSASASAPTTSSSAGTKSSTTCSRSPRRSDRIRFRELGQVDQRQSVRRARDQRARTTLKNLDRYKQLERKLYFQGGAPTDAERDEIFRAGQGRRARSPAASTRPKSAPRRWRSSWCTAWPPTTRRRSKKILDNVDLPAGPEPEPRRPDHGDRLVQQEPRHAVRSSPMPVPLPPVRRPRQQPRHVHVHAEGEPA